MSFEIKNLADATYGAQAEVDNVDLDILVQGIKGEGVVSGCAVTQRAAGANMSVDVASGTVRIAGTSVAVTSGNVAVTAADAASPRFDLVVVNNAGAKSVVAGTAAGTPEFPEVPANSVALAAVYVPAAATSVATAQITDKRVNVSAGAGALDDLTDVDVSTTPPADGDRLTYDLATGLWKPAAPGAAMINFDDLGDVDLTTTPPADGDTVVYDLATGTWVPGAASAGAGALTVIADQTLGAAAATIDFSAIAGTFKELRLVFQGRSAAAGSSDTLGLRVNNDTAANYRTPYVQGNGISASAGVDIASGYMPVCEIPAASATAGTPGDAEMKASNYTGTTFHKGFLLVGGDTNGSTEQIRASWGRWTNTAAITRLTLVLASGGNFVAGSRAILYGIG